MFVAQPAIENTCNRSCNFINFSQCLACVLLIHHMQLSKHDEGHKALTTLNSKCYSWIIALGRGRNVMCHEYNTLSWALQLLQLSVQKKQPPAIGALTLHLSGCKAMAITLYLCLTASLVGFCESCKHSRLERAASTRATSDASAEGDAAPLD